MSNWIGGVMDTEEFKADLKSAINKVSEKHSNMTSLQRFVYKSLMNQTADSVAGILGRLEKAEYGNLDEQTVLELDLLTLAYPNTRMLDPTYAGELIARYYDKNAKYYYGIMEYWANSKTPITGDKYEKEDNSFSKFTDAHYSKWGTPAIGVEYANGEEMIYPCYMEHDDNDPLYEQIVRPVQEYYEMIKKAN